MLPLNCSAEQTLKHEQPIIASGPQLAHHTHHPVIVVYDTLFNAVNTLLPQHGQGPCRTPHQA